MNNYYPKHIEGFLNDASAYFPGEPDGYHFYYQVQCDCQSRLFRVWTSKRPSVKAACAACGKEILVYDLSQYPAAAKGRRQEEFTLMRHPSGNDVCSVYVMYEYGELDDDQQFDQNDITWCQVFIENENKQRVKVVDDETA